jgi:hypothetical protein
LEQWAADINKICAQEATRVGAAFEQMRSSGNTIIELSKRYRINTPLDVATHADTLTPPMRQAFSAAATVDSSYTTTLRQMKSVDRPTEPGDKTAAKTWVGRYEQLGDTFHTMYETLANYTVSDNEILQATFFTSLPYWMGRHILMRPLRFWMKVKNWASNPASRLDHSWAF